MLLLHRHSLPGARQPGYSPINLGTKDLGRVQGICGKEPCNCNCIRAVGVLQSNGSGACYDDAGKH